MKGEFSGKSIFKHRYICMAEDDIRQEIDRLQGEVFELQQLLQLYAIENGEIKQKIYESQTTNEKLCRSVETKVQNLQDALDYTKPVKAQMDNLIKEFELNLESVYNHDGVKKQQRDIRIFSAFTAINTLLLLCLIGLLSYSIFF